MSTVAVTTGETAAGRGVRAAVTGGHVGAAGTEGLVVGDVAGVGHLTGLWQVAEGAGEREQVPRGLLLGHLQVAQSLKLQLTPGNTSRYTVRTLSHSDVNTDHMTSTLTANSSCFINNQFYDEIGVE